MYFTYHLTYRLDNDLTYRLDSLHIGIILTRCLAVLVLQYRGSKGIHTYTKIHLYIYVCIQIHIYTWNCVYTRTDIHIYICVYVCVCVFHLLSGGQPKERCLPFSCALVLFGFFLPLLHFFCCPPMTKKYERRLKNVTSSLKPTCKICTYDNRSYTYVRMQVYWWCTIPPCRTYFNFLLFMHVCDTDTFIALKCLESNKKSVDSESSLHCKCIRVYFVYVHIYGWTFSSFILFRYSTSRSFVSHILVFSRRLRISFVRVGILVLNVISLWWNPTWKTLESQLYHHLTSQTEC